MLILYSTIIILLLTISITIYFKQRKKNDSSVEPVYSTNNGQKRSYYTPEQRKKYKQNLIDAKKQNGEARHSNSPKGEKKTNQANENQNSPLQKNRKQKKDELREIKEEFAKSLEVSPNETKFMDEIKEYYRNVRFEKLEQELEVGNVEYKLKLVPIHGDRLEQLISQLQFRLAEGHGEAIYEVGVEDDGTPKGISDSELETSLKTLHEMSKKLGAAYRILRVRDGVEGGKIAEVMIRKLSEDEKFSEIRIAAVGNVDVGKSTLLGVLSKGSLDNGRGKARANIFKHKHELETGRTSDIGREILGFDSTGDIVNYSSLRAPTWAEICKASSKVVTFVDLAGHEKYLKTTVFGLTGNYPDYTMLMIGSNMGVIGMTKEHYQLTLALKVPCFFVITKIDMCPPNVLEQTLNILKKMLKAPGSKKIPFLITNEDDVVGVARNFNSERIAPIFQISNVTGENLHLLRMFLNLLPPRKDWDKLMLEPTLFYVDNTFTVPGAGTVISGTLVKGTIELNQTFLLGPDEFGKFKPTTIKGIHTNRLPVKMAKAGQSVSLALKKIKRSSTRKGQVLCDPAHNPYSVWEFDAEIYIITHSTTIKEKYEAVIHCGCTRQTATIMACPEVLRAGLKGRVRFRYKYRPEYLTVGDRIIFREGKTKGIGNVVQIYNESLNNNNNN